MTALKFELGADGIALLSIAVPGRTMNVLTPELTTELASLETDLGDLLGMDTTSNEDAPVVRLLYSVFEQALRLRASDIHIEPQEKQLRIRFRIDGVLHVQTEADAKIASAVALRLKLMSGLDIADPIFQSEAVEFESEISDQGALCVTAQATVPTLVELSAVVELVVVGHRGRGHLFADPLARFGHDVGDLQACAFGRLFGLASTAQCPRRRGDAGFVDRQLGQRLAQRLVGGHADDPGHDGAGRLEQQRVQSHLYPLRFDRVDRLFSCPTTRIFQPRRGAPHRSAIDRHRRHAAYQQ